MLAGEPRLGALAVVVVGDSNTDRRLVTEPDRSCRTCMPSGDDSFDLESGSAVDRNEFARSITDGDLDGSRFLTAKNVEDGRSRELTTGGASPDDAESFSSALMRCDMLEPRLDFFSRLPPCCDDCWLTCYK